MKLLIIHNKYQSNNIGGEDIVYKNELEILQKKLGKINVLSYEVSNNDISKFKLIFGIWFSFKYYKEIKNIVNKSNVDLVHIHNFYPLLTPSVFKASKDGGAKVVHTLHNYRLWCISGIFYRDGYGVCELCTKNKFSLKGVLNKCFRKSIIQSLLAQFSFWFYRLIKVFDNVDYFTNDYVNLYDKKVFEDKTLLYLKDKYNKLIKKDYFVKGSIFYSKKNVFDKILDFIENNNYKQYFINNFYEINIININNSPIHFIERLFSIYKQ